MKFGSRSVDAILACQWDGRRPQLVGYGAFPLTILSPLLEAGTDFVYCECPAIAAHLPFLLPGTTSRRTTLATIPVRFHAGLRKAHFPMDPLLLVPLSPREKDLLAGLFH